ncbi:hypothetical protein [Fibrella aquatilis]|uniref:Uncharacterized protein n=1 Tax=Fibrella aquatilis TaxID=2817059 RepID=A0A939G0U9_9BACT|nr:hypothetical protein [Fibrella aquatilis]MBO0930342.1 hypothetical protein [Fibrella aquatilis]
MTTDQDPDIEWVYDLACPQCGHEPVYRRDCISLVCEDGMVDESEDDFCLPGTILIECSECNGHGDHLWCPQCGYDLNDDPAKLLVDVDDDN